MSGDSDRYRTQIPDLLDRIKDLDRRLSVLERVPGIGNTTIDRGTLKIKDESGIVRVELGLLSDGTYGLNVKENAADPGFHQVPFVYTQFITTLTGETCTSGTYADLATVGPQVTVPVRSTGRILIIATAQIQWATPQAALEFGSGVFNVEFSGANTRTITGAGTEPNDPLVGVSSNQFTVTTGAIGFTNIIAVTAQAVFENLNPGNTTICMKYRRSNAVTVNPDFFRRTLTVVNL